MCGERGESGEQENVRNYHKRRNDGEAKIIHKNIMYNLERIGKFYAPSRIM